MERVAELGSLPSARMCNVHQPRVFVHVRFQAHGAQGLSHALVLVADLRAPHPLRFLLLGLRALLLVFLNASDVGARDFQASKVLCRSPVPLPLHPNLAVFVELEIDALVLEVLRHRPRHRLGLEILNVLLVLLIVFQEVAHRPHAPLARKGVVVVQLRGLQHQGNAAELADLVLGGAIAVAHVADDAHKVAFEPSLRLERAVARLLLLALGHFPDNVGAEHFQKVARVLEQPPLPKTLTGRPCVFFGRC
mmetsp:Transcript_57514/g.136819  ORF Transcript_57514/g.136819 Transcript_57514/m.136819 type:complete len:250 (-) Transcript_57514:644-1393(-)